MGLHDPGLYKFPSFTKYMRALIHADICARVEFMKLDYTPFYY